MSKTISYDYNLDGSLQALHYPSGAVVTYTSDAAGRTISAVDTTNAASPINYVTGATYGPDNALTGFISGNSTGFAGITNKFFYTPRLQPCRMLAGTGTLPSSCSNTTNAPAGTLDLTYDFHYGNGNNGNVWGITNNKDTTRNQTFAYDVLNRLTSARNAGTDCTQTVLGNLKKFWGNTYGYDAWGNLLNKSSLTNTCAGEGLSVAVGGNNRISTAGYHYDAAGNMTLDGLGHTYTFDQENRITGAAGYTYTYDADGNRVEKTNGSSGTLYWYMTPGIVAESDLLGTLKSEYVFFGGERVARRDLAAPTGVSYYFSDHLKTASVITDSAGVIKAESDYYPWGGEFQFVNNDSNRYKFTGKERDSESGLDYFGARYYASSLGRFVTPDWRTNATDVPYAEFSDPQSLNLYTYVRNVPTTRLDTDGHLQKAAVAAKTAEVVAACVASAPCVATAVTAGDVAAVAFGPGIGGMTVVTALPPMPDQGIWLDALTPTYQPAPALQSENANASSSPASSVSTQGSGSTQSSGSAQPAGPNGPYKRPNNATTKEQRASVQGKPCATCGKNEGQKNNADHRDPLVEQHYRNGIDPNNMRDPSAVRPQCQSCSSQQGGFLRSFSEAMKKLFGFD